MDDDTAPLPLPPLAARNADSPASDGSWAARAYVGGTRMLPALILGLLAALSWWLLRHSAEVPETNKPVSSSRDPDYEMRGFSVRRTGAGEAWVEGDQLRHFPQTDTVLIDGARVQLRRADGSQMKASAPQARLVGDRREVHLSGGAALERRESPTSAILQVESESLTIDTEQQTVRTDTRVTLRLGGDEVSGGALRYDHPSRVLNLLGGVQGRLGTGSRR
jgi:lipopolysaccharide export system protein LptC